MTAADPRTKAALGFILKACLWVLGLFVLTRIGIIEQHVLLPFTMVQKKVADLFGGYSATPVRVTMECSGTDVMALCLGAILAYPVSWRRRLLGGLGSLALILALNVTRIGTLSHAASSPEWFNLLHVYLWPAFLIFATVGYVFWWMTATDQDQRKEFAEKESPRAFVFKWRFVAIIIVCVAIFVAASPWLYKSEAILHAAAWIARASAGFLNILGIPASVHHNILTTDRGNFRVTQECILTPLIPVYIAFALCLPLSWSRRVLAIALAGPIFIMLGMARLLVLALPRAIAPSPLLLIHAFFQIVLAMLLVVAAGYWQFGVRRRDWKHATGRVVLALMIGLVVMALGGRLVKKAVFMFAWMVRGLFYPEVTAPSETMDLQMALALMPIFQLALLAALWVAAISGLGWRRLGGALLILLATQVFFVAVISEIWQQTGNLLHVRYIRAWSVAAPILLLLLVGRRQLFGPGSSATKRADGPGGCDKGRAEYKNYWDELGENFPDLGGAASTRYYFENECRLLKESLPGFRDIRIFKTDLWDEAKNTRILNWASTQGAHVCGIDISAPIVMQARSGFTEGSLASAVADTRQIPFRDGTVDAIYSMGTVEHFENPTVALKEMHRILKPGGRLILGVPNKWDPFLRPVLVAFLRIFNLYAYGYEKSFSRRELNGMLEEAGFRIEKESGILFIPGWLRMLDLACHVWLKPLSNITGILVWPFATLDRHIPTLRKHGYLIASVGIKSGAD
ncbi:methyltransferase domain-containing protein [Acidobacteriota bacterium]